MRIFGGSQHWLDMRYFLTFRCYGSLLHGDEAGAVDRRHNLFGRPTLGLDPRRASAARRRMTQPGYGLDRQSRGVVLQAIEEVCQYRGWGLLAAHVRSNHVHAVVEAEVAPEKVMNDFKGYASRRLNRLGGDEEGRKRWARHGSTRWLWTDQEVRAAIRYVVEEQGEEMAVFVGEVP